LRHPCNRAKVGRRVASKKTTSHIAAGCEPRLHPLEPWPNILLISLDALRAQHLKCYGYHRDTSPFLDSLAAQGTLFSNAFVNTHGTPSSHTTILTSLYQETHRLGYRIDSPDPLDLAVPSGVVMLQEILYGQGYQTVAVTDNGYMASEYGFDRGFQDYEDEGNGVAEGTKKLLDSIGRRMRGGGPIFAFYHTYEIHSPYVPPPEYQRIYGDFESELVLSNENLIRIQDSAMEHLSPGDLELLIARYDGEIRYTDDTLRQMFAELETLGFLENCLVIITSDHGEEFGDHGGLLHRDTLYEELLRVPLILWGQGVVKGTTDERLVSSVDIVPTVLGLLRLRVELPLAGIDLLSEREQALDRPIYAQYGNHRFAIRTQRWKLIESPLVGRLELYDLEQDPEERTNLASEEKRIAEDLRRRLQQWQQSCPRLELQQRSVKPPAELVERLRALGYVQ
jgi:arylsulfatase A-like enzyme